MGQPTDAEGASEYRDKVEVSKDRYGSKTVAWLILRRDRVSVISGLR
jgi:hypothetical protein